MALELCKNRLMHRVAEWSTYVSRILSVFPKVGTKQSLKTSKGTVFNLAGMFSLMFLASENLLRAVFTLGNKKISWLKVRWMRVGWSEPCCSSSGCTSLSRENELLCGTVWNKSSSFPNRYEESYIMIWVTCSWSINSGVIWRSQATSSWNLQRF